MIDKKLHLISCPSGLAGANIHSGDGPLIVQKSPYLAHLLPNIAWDMLTQLAANNLLRIDEVVRMINLELAKKVSAYVKAKKKFSIIGGDHTCAIGTWS